MAPFKLDSNGTLQTENGADVQGYSVTNGVVNTNQAIGNIGPFNKARFDSRWPLQTFSVSMNLDSTPAAGAASNSFSTPIQSESIPWGTRSLSR